MATILRINEETFHESSEEDTDTPEDEGDGVEQTDGYPVHLRKILDIQWFHGDISRNIAEALLLQNGHEGSYLLRNSSRAGNKFTVSVKCQSSVKHYSLEYNPFTKAYLFGNGQFESLDELAEHFKCKPVLISESGLQIVLRYPYIRNIDEPPSYERVIRHAEGGKNAGVVQGTPDFEIGSKEGYMIKRGAIHKNWKKRWFVLQKNYLKYFKKKDSHQPLRIINLKFATGVYEDNVDNKQNCFQLILPKRTFYFHTQGPDEAEHWMNILKWKIEHYSKEKGKSTES